MKHTRKNICALALLTHPSTLPHKRYIEICTCIHTHTPTRTRPSNYPVSSTYETHMQKHLRTRTFDSSFYSTTQVIHRDMYMSTHIHIDARQHPSIYHEAPMKHTCKNMCALALLTHPSTLQHKQAPTTYETHMKTYVHPHFDSHVCTYSNSEPPQVPCIHTHTCAYNTYASSWGR